MQVRLKNLLNKPVIKYDELKYLNELLKSDLPFKTCLNLIKDDKNRQIIDSLILKLDEGFLVENIINNYLPKEIYPYMICLLKSLTFSKSLELSLSYFEKTKGNLKRLTKDIIYPLILLFASMTGLYLFNNYGFSLIVSMLKSFDINLDAINIMRLFMMSLTNIFYLLVLLFLLLFLYFKSPKRISLAYIIMCKYLPLNFVKTYFTQEFMSLFILTSELGYKTKESLLILKSLRNKPIVSLIAYHIDDKLMEGKSFKNASNIKYADSSLTKFINIASYSKNNLAILNNYVEFADLKIKTKLKIMTVIIQTISYSLIGLIIVFVYQILFLPMQALSSI